MLAIKILLTIISALFFLYVLWKKLKEDYANYAIFTTGFYAIFAMTIGSLISLNFIPDWWFWVSFGSGFLGILAGIVRYRLRFFETINAAVLGGLILLTNFFFWHWFSSNNIYSGIAIIIIVLLIFLYGIIDKHYKRISWYKSGKVGFTGFSILGFFFLIRALVATFGLDVVSFVGQIDILISGTFAFLSFLAIFNLARQKA